MSGLLLATFMLVASLAVASVSADIAIGDAPHHFILSQRDAGRLCLGRACGRPAVARYLRKFNSSLG